MVADWRVVNGRPRLVEGLAMPHEQGRVQTVVLQLDDYLDTTSIGCSTRFRSLSERLRWMISAKVD